MTLEQRVQDLGGVTASNGGPLRPMPADEIGLLEQRLGGSLPKSYRQFLEAFGGASFRETILFEPKGRLPDSVSPENRAMISVFYGGSADAPRDLVAALARYRDRMPEGFLPIASDGGGNQIAMAVGGEHDGAIYYWDHNREWDEEDYVEDDLPVPPDLKWQNVTLIADTFDQFLERLAVAPAAS
jgi:hypothetical protein